MQIPEGLTKFALWAADDEISIGGSVDAVKDFPQIFKFRFPAFSHFFTSFQLKFSAVIRFAGTGERRPRVGIELFGFRICIGSTAADSERSTKTFHSIFIIFFFFLLVQGGGENLVLPILRRDLTAFVPFAYSPQGLEIEGGGCDLQFPWNSHTHTHTIDSIKQTNFC